MKKVRWVILSTGDIAHEFARRAQQTPGAEVVAVGSRAAAPDGILDMMHVTAQGVIAGANMVLVDFHPAPPKALVDGPQAMLLRELPYFLEDIQIAREAYLKRAALRQQQV